MDEKEIKKILWIAGLKNALKFNGKPNKKAIMGKLMAQMPELRPHVKKIKPILDGIIVEISKLSLEQQKNKLLQLDPHALDKEESMKKKKELPELSGLDEFNKVVMRLAPYPSGALHIGNARMIVLNDEYVKKYNGELILFYDDTIGSPKSLPNLKTSCSAVIGLYFKLNSGKTSFTTIPRERCTVRLGVIDASHTSSSRRGNSCTLIAA